jgi:hypothetical protein
MHSTVLRTPYHDSSLYCMVENESQPASGRHRMDLNDSYPIDNVKAHSVAEKSRQRLHVAFLGCHVEGSPSVCSCPLEYLAAFVASSQL